MAVVTAQLPASSCSAGIGLRSLHVAGITATQPRLGFLEVHAENYMGETVPLDYLLSLRRDYPVSVHGVALSLGTAEQIDHVHLGRFKALVERVEPMLVSEHLAWSTIGEVLSLTRPVCEDGVAVTDEVARCLIPRECFGDLLGDPPGGWIRSHIAPEEPSPLQTQDD